MTDIRRHMLLDNFTFSSILQVFLVEFSITHQLFLSRHLEVPVLSTTCSCNTIHTFERLTRKVNGKRYFQVHGHTVSLSPDNKYVQIQKLRYTDTYLKYKILGNGMTIFFCNKLVPIDSVIKLAHIRPIS